MAAPPRPTGQRAAGQEPEGPRCTEGLRGGRTGAARNPSPLTGRAGPVAVPPTAPHARSEAHAALAPHARPAAGLTPPPRLRRKGKRGVWPPGAQPWPPEGWVGPSGEDPGPWLRPGRGAGGGGSGRAGPGARGLWPLPKGGRSYTWRLTSSIKGARGPSSQLGSQWPNCLQCHECICFLHKF